MNSARTFKSSGTNFGMRSGSSRYFSALCKVHTRCTVVAFPMKSCAVDFLMWWMEMLVTMMMMCSNFYHHDGGGSMAMTWSICSCFTRHDTRCVHVAVRAF